MNRHPRTVVKAGEHLRDHKNRTPATLEAWEWLGRLQAEEFARALREGKKEDATFELEDVRTPTAPTVSIFRREKDGRGGSFSTFFARIHVKTGDTYDQKGQKTGNVFSVGEHR